MRSRLVWGLVALNVLLAAALVGQFLRPNAARAQAPRASDYIMISGDINAGQSQLVYMIDTENDLLSARLFDGRTITDMKPAINLRRVFSEGAPGNAGAEGRDARGNGRRGAR